MLRQKIKRRLAWYKSRVQVNNFIVGRAVELLGNKVRMDGHTYSVDSPFISTGHKSTLAFGLHEMEERALIRRWMPSDLPVVEVGGGLGVVSCLINSKLARPSDHIVVEANPSLIPVLKRNRSINGARFQIINKAIAYDRDTIELGLDEEFVGSSVERKLANTAIVYTTTVEALAFEFKQFGVVCDIEGAEADLIRRELSKLGERVRYLVVELHPAILDTDVVASLFKQLETIGFDLREKMGDSVFYSR
jgi:FkbM family methyltransferase